MQLEYFTKYLSNAPVLLFVWLSVQATLLIIFNAIFPDLLFHPLP